MQTIAILRESNPEQPSYRASCGDHQAIGLTPGQALDQQEVQLTQEPEQQMGEVLVILQRFRPDDLFTAEQQARLRDLMDQQHHAMNQGQSVAPCLQAELEQLVEAELGVNIRRSQRFLECAGQSSNRNSYREP
jgi:hypothetical protein